MRVFVLLAGVILLAAVMIAGCSGGNSNKPANVAGPAGVPTPPLPPNTQPDNVRRVTITELREAMDKGKAVLIDVRGDVAYKQEHIKGALDIPENQLVSRAGELPKDKLIVLYCS